MPCEVDYLCGVLSSFIKKTGPPVPAHNLAWPDFEKLAARNLVMPIVYYAIRNSSLPHEFNQRWNQQAIGIELHHARARAATLHLCQILESEGIPSVLLRGMALAQWLYPSPALRPMVDVDILVTPMARHALPAILKKRGLSPVLVLRSQFVYKIDEVVFEIHWSFLTPKRYRDTVDAAEWLASRKPLTGWDGMAFSLSPENELIELVCHSFIHHELDGLLSLVDIGLVACLDGLDWRYISDWCEEHSVGRLFWFTIAFVDNLFSLELLQKIELAGMRCPLIQKRTLDAYCAPLFAKDARKHFVQRKLNLLHMAETPMIKLRQAVRLFNVDQLGRLVRFRPKNG
jgi:hypothetical protein